MLRRIRAFVVVLSAAWLGLGTCGCLCTFERDWHAARRQPIPCDNLAGLWEGTWESQYNGHSGKLRAIITPCGNGQYHARYHATFAVIVPYSYDTTHSATHAGDVTYFGGEQDLGCLAGGLYRYNGQANGACFTATYRADKDYGVFRMHRVGCGAGCCSDAGCDCLPACTAAQPPQHSVILSSISLQ
jgi:hypothetical protein